MRHHDDSHDDKLNHMRLWDIVVIAGSLGLSLFVCICVGVAIGRFIDVHAGTSPWGLILFSSSVPSPVSGPYIRRLCPISRTRRAMAGICASESHGG